MGDTNFTPTAFVAGATLTAAQLNTQLVTPMTAMQGSWATYNCVWTASGTAPAIGNGTLISRYNRIGHTIDVFIQVFAGSTTTFGTGSWAFTLPTGTTINTLFLADAFDSSAVTHSLVYGLISGGSLAMNGGTGVTNTLPIPWGVSDTLTIAGRYETP